MDEQQPTGPKGTAVCPECLHEIDVELEPFLRGDYPDGVYVCLKAPSNVPHSEARRRLVTTKVALGVAIQNCLDDGLEPNALIGRLSGGASDAVVTTEADEGDGDSLEDALAEQPEHPFPDLLSDEERARLGQQLADELTDPAAAARRRKAQAGPADDPPTSEPPDHAALAKLMSQKHVVAEAHFWHKSTELLDRILEEQMVTNRLLRDLTEKLT